MLQNNLNERRHSERVLLSTPQKLGTKGGEDLYLVSLSHNGAEIACIREPNWNECVHFCLSLPQGIHTISLSGEIVWEKKKNKWHAGLKFVSLSEEDKQVLEAYVDYLKRDKKLRELHQTLNVNLEQFIKKLDHLLALINFATSSTGETATGSMPRYLH